MGRLHQVGKAERMDQFHDQNNKAKLSKFASGGLKMNREIIEELFSQVLLSLPMEGGDKNAKTLRRN